jgi:uncharacterized cofD-like protein
LREQSRSSNRIVVLGAGRGLASVLRALRSVDRRLTVIVGIAYEGERGGGPEERLKGEDIGDLRRSFEALSREEGPLLRALRRPLTIERLGRHPLGNLAIASAAAALGDYGRASMWLGQQLGIDAEVLPATLEPAQRQIEVAEPPPRSQAGGSHELQAGRLRFVGDAIQSPGAAIAAIRDAKWALIAPGGLYRSVLSTVAVPDVAAALTSTAGRVIWIANLEPDTREASNLTAMDHLRALASHGVRVDVVLHDPSATLTFEPSELAGRGVGSVSRAMRASANPALHDPERLRSALSALIGPHAISTVGRSRRRVSSRRR